MAFTSANAHENLKGKTGEITKKIKIIDVSENQFGLNIRVKEDSGDEYWTTLDDRISLD